MKVESENKNNQVETSNCMSRIMIGLYLLIIGEDRKK